MEQTERCHLIYEFKTKEYDFYLLILNSFTHPQPPLNVKWCYIFKHCYESWTALLHIWTAASIVWNFQITSCSALNFTAKFTLLQHNTVNFSSYSTFFLAPFLLTHCANTQQLLGRAKKNVNMTLDNYVSSGKINLIWSMSFLIFRLNKL